MHWAKISGVCAVQHFRQRWRTERVETFKSGVRENKIAFKRASEGLWHDAPSANQAMQAPKGEGLQC